MLVTVCPIDALVPGKSTTVTHKNETYAVFNINGSYYACGDTCPHAGGPLHQADIRGTTIICPWHGWDFDLSVDEATARDGVSRYPVRVEDGMIKVELPD